jgi:hypothetical protein
MPDFNRSRKTWHDHLARWGGGVNNGSLVRAGVVRAATMAMSQYTPRERASINIDNVVRIVVSAYTVPATGYVDFEQDLIRFAGKEYKIHRPPEGQQPDGTWIAFDCQCTFLRDL